MSDFPQTLGPHDTSDGGSWTAEFDSFDPRMEDAYYLVTREDADGVAWGFFVKVDFAGGVPHEKWEEHLVASIQPRADGEGRNTNYTGNPMKWLAARKAAAKEAARRDG